MAVIHSGLQDLSRSRNGKASPFCSYPLERRRKPRIHSASSSSQSLLRPLDSPTRQCLACLKPYRKGQNAKDSLLSLLTVIGWSGGGEPSAPAALGRLVVGGLSEKCHLLSGFVIGRLFVVFYSMSKCQESCIPSLSCPDGSILLYAFTHIHFYRVSTQKLLTCFAAKLALEFSQHLNSIGLTSTCIYHPCLLASSLHRTWRLHRITSQCQVGSLGVPE